MPLFERLNPDVSVNVFGYDTECDEDVKPEVFPLYITPHTNRKHVNLLLISDKEKQHYVYIKNLSRLLANPRLKYAKYFCVYCLNGFTSQKTLDEHVSWCREMGKQKTTMPNPDEAHLKFTEIQKQLTAPFIIYADCESFLEPVDTCLPDGSSTVTTQTHTV